MAGWLTNGVPAESIQTGAEQFSLDTETSGGQAPQTSSITLLQLATAAKYYASAVDKTMVAGTRYYSSVYLGNPCQLTGIAALVGSTGGTDNWLFELHDPTGALVATTTTSGTTAGTANTFQRIAFTAVYNVTTPGTYYIAVQSNGTSAKLGTYASAGLPMTNGSATGTFGTGASITPPTSYTANLGPIALVY